MHIDMTNSNMNFEDLIYNNICFHDQQDSWQHEKASDVQMKPVSVIRLISFLVVQT